MKLTNPTEPIKIVGFHGSLKHQPMPADLLGRMSHQTRRAFEQRDADLVYIAKGLGADRTQRSIHNPHADELEHYSLQAFSGSECVMDLPY